MSALTIGLLLTLLFQIVVILLLVAAGLLFPQSFLGAPAKTVLNWVPPFLGGQALQNWAATAAERLARKRLAGKRTAGTVCELADEMEAAAMHAMIPLAEQMDLERVVTCPKTGQGRVGVTAPEVLAIAAHIRQEKSRSGQRRIYELAVGNAKQIASRAKGDTAPCPCALQGKDQVCCVFAHRPLRCRPLHAIVIANELGRHDTPSVNSPTAESGHERIVALGIETGLTRALKTAGLDANRYELNSALAVALATPDAAERWAKGEDVFHQATRVNATPVAAV